MSGHGTYGGYQQHKKTGEPPCQPCRDANRLYHAGYRQLSPGYVRRNNLANAALQRAKTRVANAHPDELRRAYAEELATQPAQQEGATA